MRHRCKCGSRARIGDCYGAPFCENCGRRLRILRSLLRRKRDTLYLLERTREWYTTSIPNSAISVKLGQEFPAGEGE